MTRNADNRTTEQTATNHLRTLLDERGIEYAESQDRFRTRFRFNYCEACGDYLNEIEIMGACITASKSYLTPEQAIAATMGSEREKALEELVRDMWHEITTCPDYTVPPCMTDGICERVRNLGVEMGGDGDE